jgi:hypothetical protein
VRWDDLFADLEGMAAAAHQADLVAEVADRSRYEWGRLDWLVRVRAAGLGRVVDLLLVDGDRVRGPLLGSGQDWLAVANASADVVVAGWAVRRATMRGPRVGHAVASEPAISERLGLRHVVRLLARDRTYVRVRIVGGDQASGTVDRAGADHLELAEHQVDRPRRNGEVSAWWMVPYAAVVTLRGGSVWKGEDRWS